MSIRIVPTTAYPTIQSAIDVSTAGDIIEITADSTFAENLVISSAQNGISIIAKSKTVIINGATIGGTAMLLQANNVTVTGLSFQNFDEGFIIMGDKNKITAVTVKKSSKSGFLTYGNYNQLISCIASDNGSAGIDIAGNYNQFVASRLDSNKRGLTATSGQCKKNVIYKNIIINNVEFGIRISNPESMDNIIIENTVTGSPLGILYNYGSVAIVCNYVRDCTNTGIIYKDNDGLFLENVLVNDNQGMYLDTCNSLIASNTIQSGAFTGMTIIGNDNRIIQNVITGYENTGLLLNGCKNGICNNTFVKNGINEIISGEDNKTDCNCSYCYALGCKDNCYTQNGANYLGLLEILKKPMSFYYYCDAHDCDNCQCRSAS